MGGAVGMFAAILILALIGLITKAVNNVTAAFAVFSAPHKVACSIFFANFINLILLGSSPAAAPYVISSKAATGIYFGYFIIVLPLLAFLGNEVLAASEKTEVKPLSITPTTATPAEETAKTVSTEVEVAVLCGGGPVQQCPPQHLQPQQLPPTVQSEILPSSRSELR